MKSEKSWKAWVGLIEVSALATGRFCASSSRYLAEATTGLNKPDFHFRLRLARETLSSTHLDLHLTSALEYRIEQMIKPKPSIISRRRDVDTEPAVRVRRGGRTYPCTEL